LFQRWIGKDIADVPKPAAVLDRAIIRWHCKRMKKTVQARGVGFRAHVKTHKVS
jgi:D-serine deaminase-like pyridoxal phosphate-dependent protein